MAYDVPAGASFAYETSLCSLEEQLRRIEALDTKAGVLLAADGILAGFLFSRGSILLRAPDWIAISAALAILASMALALVGFAARQYKASPKPEAIVRRAGASEAWLKWRFVPNVLRAFDLNAIKLATKARFIVLSLLTLLVGVGTTGAYLMFTIVTTQ